MGQRDWLQLVTVPTDSGKPVTGNPTRSVVLRIRNELLSTEDTVCLERARLVTEVYQRFEDDPPALRRAKTFAHVLRTMTLDVETNPFFAGNTSTRPRAWMLAPEYGFMYPPQIIHENPQLDGLLEGQIPQEMLDYWEDRCFGGNSGIGHLAVDLDRVVHEGLAAIVSEAERYAGVGTESEQVTRQAMAIALQAVMDWAGRYAEAAEVVDKAKARIEDRTGIPPGHMILNATHAHTGPRHEEKYDDWLVEKIADTVQLAVARLVPARKAASDYLEFPAQGRRVPGAHRRRDNDGCGHRR